MFELCSGTVQGSTLRFARAVARPSGLDGACAQLADRPLRDGRRLERAAADSARPTLIIGTADFDNQMKNSQMKKS
jgi:hypothetical protein